MNVELPGVLLSTCTAEGIDRGSDLDVFESGFLEHPFPACARQAPYDSARPEIDVADRLLRDRLAVCDVGELYPPPKAEHPLNFRKSSYTELVRRLKSTIQQQEKG